MRNRCNDGSARLQLLDLPDGVLHEVLRRLGSSRGERRDRQALGSGNQLRSGAGSEQYAHISCALCRP